MRLFFAVELPDELVEALSETSALLRDSVRGRYVSPDRLHVTLAFLGEVSWSELAGLSALLDEVAARHDPFEATLGPLGSFGRARRATLWQGFERGQEELAALAQDLRTELRSSGFAFDTKAFLPHVTLMRAADVQAGQLPMPHIECGRITRVTLFSSDLTGERPVYTAQHSSELGGADRETDTDGA